MVKAAAALLLLSAAVAQAQESTKAIVKFRMAWGGIEIADVTDTIEFAGDRYAIKSEAVPIGLAKVIGQPPIDRYSEGTFNGLGLLPERYEYLRDGKSRLSVIDRSQGKVMINTEGNEKTVELVQDKIHDNLTLAYNFYATGALPEKGMFLLTDGKRVSEVEFAESDAGPEMIETGLGTIKARKIIRTNNKPGREYAIWVSEDYRMVPVMYLNKTQNSEITFILQSVEFIDS